MADYIKKEHALNHPFANGNFDKTNANMNFINGIKSYQEYIELLPSVDAVEAVRCKDCKYNDDGVCDRMMWNHEKWGLSTQYVEDDDYCKWGEKE